MGNYDAETLFVSILLMTRPAPRVGERSSSHRNELPRIGSRPQRKLQHAVRRSVGHLAVRDRRTEGIVALPARADHELPDTTRRVRHARRGLRSKALVVVLVTGKHHVGAG